MHLESFFLDFFLVKIFFIDVKQDKILFQTPFLLFTHSQNLTLLEPGFLDLNSKHNITVIGHYKDSITEYKIGN